MDIVIKTSMKELPEHCDDCIYYETRPHPYKGRSDSCGLCMQYLDDGDEDWIYDGNSRPKKCPLMEIDKKNLTSTELAQRLMDERIHGELNEDMQYIKDVIEDVKCKLSVEIIDRRPCYCGAELREVWRNVDSD